MAWTDTSVKDTSDAFIATLRSGDDEGHNALKRLLVRDILSAKFALCLKGIGLSSFRIFEAMLLARAPVIIADGWSAPSWTELGRLYNSRTRTQCKAPCGDLVRTRVRVETAW